MHNLSILFSRIEHVFPDVLEEIPFQIFGMLKPKIVVLTTPNGEFNVLFDMKPGTFRHDDHKFEWTREEFEAWSNHICVRFPDYCVQFHGIGKPPKGIESVGHCSQLGFFIRKDFLNSLDEELEEEVYIEPTETELIECDDYKLVASVDYPFFHDTRNLDEKILDEVTYHLSRFRAMEEKFFNYEADRFEIPIDAVANSCWQITDNNQEIRRVIEGKFQLENDFVIFSPNESECSEDEEEPEEERESEIAPIS